MMGWRCNKRGWLLLRIDGLSSDLVLGFGALGAVWRIEAYSGVGIHHFHSSSIKQTKSLSWKLKYYISHMHHHHHHHH